jgi:hypothetical protein
MSNISAKEFSTIARMAMQRKTREQLRDLARHFNVRRGQNTKDTINYLCAAIEDGRIGGHIHVELDFINE